MPESDQPSNPSFDRPSARAGVGAPIQRSNYGIPPRRPQPMAPPAQSAQFQSNPAAQPTSPPAVAPPRYMDVAAPVRPQPVTQPTPAAPPVQAPVQSAPQPAVPANPLPLTPAPKPLFSAQPAPQLEAQPKKSRQLLRNWRLAVLIVAALLSIGGIARWATAGSTKGHIIAVGAVKANDGYKMTIQFVADDGQLHKFTAKSQAELIPGTALEVAYRSGAPETTAKQVGLIKQTRSLGLNLLLLGIGLFAALGIVSLVQRLRHRKPAEPLTTPVTA